MLFIVSPGEGCQIYCRGKPKDAEITDGAAQTQETVMVVNDKGVKKDSTGRQRKVIYSVRNTLI